MFRLTWTMDTRAVATAGGLLTVCWTPGSALGPCEETIFLQQSWLWLAGLHGMVPQHCMVCWSADTVRQSANCTSRAKLAASNRDAILRIIPSILAVSNIRVKKKAVQATDRLGRLA